MLLRIVHYLIALKNWLFWGILKLRAFSTGGNCVIAFKAVFDVGRSSSVAKEKVQSVYNNHKLILTRYVVELQLNYTLNWLIKRLTQITLRQNTFAHWKSLSLQSLRRSCLGNPLYFKILLYSWTYISFQCTRSADQLNWHATLPNWA